MIKRYSTFIYCILLLFNLAIAESLEDIVPKLDLTYVPIDSKIKLINDDTSLDYNIIYIPNEEYNQETTYLNQYIPKYNKNYPVYMQYNRNPFNYKYADLSAFRITSNEYIKQQEEWQKKFSNIKSEIIEKDNKKIEVFSRIQVEEIYSKIAYSCPIEGEYAKADLLWGTILFDAKSDLIKQNYESILTKTVNVQMRCNKRILLVANTSFNELKSYEKIPDMLVASLKISMLRATAIKSNLINKGVPESMINIILCGASMPRYLENTGEIRQAVEGNQRVDIVFNTLPYEWITHLCIVK